MKQEFTYGSKKIAYNLTFSKRKTLGITVSPEMEILVKAPEETSLALIEEKLEKRAIWILNQQSYFLQFLPGMPEKQFRGGESHFYLGRRYRLRVRMDKKTKLNSPAERSKFIIPQKVRQGRYSICGIAIGQKQSFLRLPNHGSGDSNATVCNLKGCLSRRWPPAGEVVQRRVKSF